MSLSCLNSRVFSIKDRIIRRTWYVYILECKEGALYTGVTNDLKRRFKEHLKETSHYTSYNPPKKIACREPCQSKLQAFKREKQIKGWTRRKKIALINGDLELLKRLK